MSAASISAAPRRPPAPAAWVPATDGYRSVACIGDSLTAGLVSPYPSQLAALLGYNQWVSTSPQPFNGNTGQNYVYNGGYGSATSPQIIARQGGVSIAVTVTGGTIPASGSVAVTTSVDLNNSTGTKTVTGSLSGIRGTLDGASLTFTRFAPGSATASGSNVNFVVDTVGVDGTGTPYAYQHSRLADINVIWVGQNNYDPVTGALVAGSPDMMADIAAAVAAMTATNKKYIVMGFLNGGTSGTWKNGPAYTVMKAREANLLSTYPANFLNIRDVLVASYNPANSQDVTDFGNDTVPTSLRVDVIHLNAAGNAIVAREVKRFMDRKGWSLS